ncbi:MAG: SGNH/GDSL hydrolase family protein [Clostridia bacterium]|nr:SGNH/GDSL hydrolase family protein [Clostridia bacterium]
MLRKKLGLFLACMTMFCAATACGENTETPDTDTSTSTGGEIVDTSKLGTVDTLVENFWETDTMYDETVLMVAETDAAGNVISLPKAKLLFAPEEILSVKQYYHIDNDDVVTFAENVDFTVEDGYIIAKGDIRENMITEKYEFIGSMPYVTDKALTGEGQFPSIPQSTTIPSTDAGLYLPFTESYQIVQMQLSVTYKHAENVWTGAVPIYHGETLSKTVAKLKAKEEVNVFVYGDSISTGANSSGHLNIRPYLPSFPSLICENLSRYYGATVKLTNKSVGGFTSSQGVNGGLGWVNGVQVALPGLSQIFSEELANYSPDLAIIGFGMNDATLGVSINEYCNNIMSMIATIRARNPECDIILVGTMLANPKALNQAKNQTEFSAYLSRVANQYEGVAVVDVGLLHQDILDAGKHFTEISSNNVNHPNDFMTRVYAMHLLTALIEK